MTILGKSGKFREIDFWLAWLRGGGGWGNNSGHCGEVDEKVEQLEIVAFIC